MITLGLRSTNNLIGVIPSLVRVVHRAALNAMPDQDFTVLEGVRTDEQMCINWGKGRTADQCRTAGISGAYAQPLVPKVTWLKSPLLSNHRKMPDGFGHAVDLVPYPIDYSKAGIPRFRALYDLMMEAAHQESVKIRCGYDWNQNGVLGERGETDLGHYEVVA